MNSRVRILMNSVKSETTIRQTVRNRREQIHDWNIVTDDERDEVLTKVSLSKDSVFRK